MFMMSFYASARDVRCARTQETPTGDDGDGNDDDDDDDGDHEN